jgi:hypothetical protein
VAQVEIFAGRRVLVCDPEGPPLAGDRHAGDLVGEALGAGAEVVAIPTARVTPAFFDLRTGLAGAVLQKFVNYRLVPVIVGDIGAELARSSALRDFVRESNRGQTVWFVAGLDELRARLG